MQTTLLKMEIFENTSTELKTMLGMKEECMQFNYVHPSRTIVHRNNKYKLPINNH